MACLIDSALLSRSAEGLEVVLLFMRVHTGQTNVMPCTVDLETKAANVLVFYELPCTEAMLRICIALSFNS